MINSHSKIVFLLAVGLLPLMLRAQCNGHQQLCGKRYNEVAYLTTHNAYNAAEDGFNLPNHNFGITRQLQDGVRGLMLDVYDEGGVPTVYHSFSFLGTATLESNLNEIKDFLDSNPNEVVTIIFESYINSTMMDTAFAQVGLKPMLHAQPLGQPWPTLQEMIDTDKRLVVLSDENDAEVGQEWYHYVWDFAVETHFTNHAPGDFECDFNRGDAGNDLFIVNHFVTDANIGIGISAQAAVVNGLSFFYDRVHGCQLEQQKFPNFPTVDFHELGQTMAVVDSLNGIQSTTGMEERSASDRVSVFPNPGSGQFHLSWNGEQQVQIRVFNSKGELVLQLAATGSSQDLDLSGFPKGVYHVSILGDRSLKTLRLVNL